MTGDVWFYPVSVEFSSVIWFPRQRWHGIRSMVVHAERIEDDRRSARNRTAENFALTGKSAIVMGAARGSEHTIAGVWSHKGADALIRSLQSRCRVISGRQTALTPTVVYRIFESFLAAGCPNVTILPRKEGGRGVKPFGHALGSFRQKVLKYSAKTPLLRVFISSA
jgi:hypothetical protein